MSSTRYIEIVSTRRNRVEYPNIAEFIVPVSGSNSCGGNGYIDPLSTLAPTYIFLKGSLNHTGTTNNSTYVDPGLDVTVPQPNVPGGSNILYRGFSTAGSFKGYLFVDNSISTVAAPLGANRLTTNFIPTSATVSLDIPEEAAAYATGDSYAEYDYSGNISNDLINSPYPNALPVYDYRRTFCPQPFDIFGGVCPTLRRIFVNNWLAKEPVSGAVTTPESIFIQQYDTNTRQLLIASQFSSTQPVTTQAIYSVRPVQPTGLYNGRVINGVQQTIKSIFQVVALTGVNRFTVTPGSATPLVGGVADPGYAGNYIYFAPQVGDPALVVNYPNFQDPRLGPPNYFYRIISYPANDTFVVDRPIDTTAFVGGTIATRPAEVLPVNFETFSPMEYSGSIVSQNETVCYEISLVSLTLPNVELVSGSRVAFYPYVYVLLENQTVTSGVMRGIFYSNNPSTHRALFVAPVTDTNDPENTPYVRIDGFGITQTVKFKPNDALHFKVFMPDGSLFQPILSDTQPPLPPDPLLQLSAVFSIRRLA
jgi:hypothetical protein